MSGDKFNVRVTSWYKPVIGSPSSPYDPLQDLLATMSTSLAGAATHCGVTQSQLVGQEAHRQEQAKLKKEGAEVEVPITLKDGTNVRKDTVKRDGTVVIIKPDTKTGKASAAKRESLMRGNGYNTEVIFYDPKNSSFLPWSPNYIGPKRK